MTQDNKVAGFGTKFKDFFGLGAEHAHMRDVEDPYQTEQIAQVQEPEVVRFAPRGMGEVSKVHSELKRGNIAVIDTNYLDDEAATRVLDFAAGLSLGVYGEMCLRNLGDGILAIVNPKFNVTDRELLRAVQ
ncbi:MAG: cell division protein SepF [Corynebacterium sp.]|nr:cell division protein SepF [Corynebacterium sp.]